jgi:hypothetical protein
VVLLADDVTGVGVADDVLVPITVTVAVVAAAIVTVETVLDKARTWWNEDNQREKKVPRPHVGGKEGAKDIPSWAEGERPYVDESGRDFADRLLDARHGPGNYPKAPASEWSKIRKWGDRAFKNP